MATTLRPTAFLRGLRELCDEHGILLIADEVQCGYGRTGRMWGFEHAGIVPDVVVVAKAIANGLPLSAIVSSRELQERWGRGAHGSTFGGNPVACAAGVAVLETLRDEGLVENAVARGAELVSGLGKIAAEDDRIGDIRGLGLMVGVEFTDPALPDQLMAACADAGLLVLTCGRPTRPSAGSHPSTSPPPRSPKRSRSSGRRWPGCRDKCRQRAACFTQAVPIRIAFADVCRDTRNRLGLTQEQLGRSVGVTHGYVAKVEAGTANPSLDLVERIAVALDLEIDLVVRVPTVIGDRRQRDLVHARCSGFVDRRLRAAKWLTAREVEIVHGRSHGWIDLLAFDEGDRLAAGHRDQDAS